MQQNRAKQTILTNLFLSPPFILTVGSVSKKSSELLFTLTLGSYYKRTKDVIRDTEYGALISIYHSLDNTKKRNFKTKFQMAYVPSK